LDIKDDPYTPLFAELYTRTIDTFNLGDIDPKTIQLTLYDSGAGGLPCEWETANKHCDVAKIGFETRNQLPFMDETFQETFPKLKGRDHESGGVSKTFVAVNYVNDAEYAHRVLKAFLHATDLCGGRSSTF